MHAPLGGVALRVAPVCSHAGSLNLEKREVIFHRRTLVIIDFCHILHMNATAIKFRDNEEKRLEIFVVEFRLEINGGNRYSCNALDFFRDLKTYVS